MNINGPAKAEAGERGVPVTVGGARIEAGDWVVGDSDGVVVVPAAAIEQTLAVAQQRAEAEIAVLRKLDGGATTLEVYGPPK